MVTYFKIAIIQVNNQTIFNHYMKQLTILSILTFCFFQITNAQCISGDCTNGTGIFLYASGAKYVGQFQDGEIHGIGTCYYTDGTIYRGQWNHRFPEGEGTKIFPDGKEWRGQWLKGQPVDEEGNVIAELFPEEAIDLDDGTNIQSGCLAGNCIDGEGVFAYPDGSKYEGQFMEERPDGWGTFHYPNGDKFTGTFQSGYRHGKGTFYHTNETQTIGEWRGGEYMGNPNIEHGQIGCISGNCKDGEGMLIYPDGAAKYIGMFTDGKPNGEGVINYANGERYKGTWKAGNYHGKGTLFLMDGTKVDGYWEEGTYMGIDDPNEPKREMPEVVTDAMEDLIAFRKTTDLKVWAVVVGVSSYNHMPTLRYTDDDAYRMYAFLKSPEGGALPDNQIRILIDEDATKEHITKTMKDIFGQADANDLVFLYFSGHGLKGSFLPIDFDGFNNKLEHQEINSLLKQSPAKYKLCIADACHSGSLLAMKSGAVRNVLEDYYKSLAQADPGTALIMSSKSDETSLESSGLRQGVFSHFLIRGLKGEADVNENKIVTIQELYDYIEEKVRNYTGNRQSPIIRGDYDPRMTVGVVR